MAKKIKDHYDDAYAQMLAGKIKAAVPHFAERAFLDSLAGELEKLEFSARIDRIVTALDASLPGHYAENLALLHAVLGDELPTETGMFTEGWWLWPLARYVERHATEDFEASIAFIKELTKRHTGEFAVRPLLRAFPLPMLDVMHAWSLDDNVHVRRLASEGLRIRLPWAKKLLIALEHFDRYAAILTNLKDDPSRFVQKSVGNNLNDLYKEAPDKAAALIASWQQGALSKAAQWIIRHGRRNQHDTFS